ncbi:MAG TPA: TetR/AcrR family transcriptional regulator [Candidatus Acidoferrum sp.]|jgi:AcrR family transcriptional regulator|nr:TetR/AcrR family transcriptional regulator [Candidatus Acidoferrum sp.]
MLHQDCEKLDPRIRRTRQLLQGALKRLLEEKDFDKITIQDITETATLNRATFYAHYPDKFALLEELIRVSFLQLLDCRKVRFDGSCATAFHPTILAVCDYLAELQKSHSSKQRQFEAFVEGTVIDQIRVILMDGYKKHPVERNIPPEMIAAAASWAIYGAAKQWVNSSDRIPAEEFVATAANLVTPILMTGIVSVANS